MTLNRVERAKITDTALKIQSAQASLEGLDSAKVDDFEEIQNCLEMAESNLRQALRSKSDVEDGR